MTLKQRIGRLEAAAGVCRCPRCGHIILPTPSGAATGGDAPTADRINIDPVAFAAFEADVEAARLELASGPKAERAGSEVP